MQVVSRKTNTVLNRNKKNTSFVFFSDSEFVITRLTTSELQTSMSNESKGEFFFGIKSVKFSCSRKVVEIFHHPSNHFPRSLIGCFVTRQFILTKANKVYKRCVNLANCIVNPFIQRPTTSGIVFNFGCQQNPYPSAKGLRFFSHL